MFTFGVEIETVQVKHNRWPEDLVAFDLYRLPGETDNHGRTLRLSCTVLLKRTSIPINVLLIITATAVTASGVTRLKRKPCVTEQL